MAKDSVFFRSFGRFEMKTLSCVALALGFIMSLSLFNFFKQPVMDLEASLSLGLKVLIGSDNKHQQKSLTELELELKLPPSISNLSNSISDMLEITGDVRVHGKSFTVFVASATENDPTRSWALKPYARKHDTFLMGYIREWTVVHGPASKLPGCEARSPFPGIIFSTRGYAMNPYHDFSDLLVPLYLTARPYNRSIVLLVNDLLEPWIEKYERMLKKLSSQEIANIDDERRVVCFPRVTVGLRAHKELGIDPREPPHYSMAEFREFVQATWALRARVWAKKSPRARMLMISRERSRRMTNERAVARVARRVGFDVVVREIGSTDDVAESARFVNSFDVMAGVHGAGMTNMVFLPEGGVAVEVVPFGLDGLARQYYRAEAEGMGLGYLEYRVGWNESSLKGKYSVESEVYREPGKIQKKGFLGFRAVYMDDQDVEVDCGRFEETLVEALRMVSKRNV
ncbi:glycosyltransferase family 61 protein [Striga asiatica]|uniref:Glycosyltransferase family 61 protein n=1 Tax=Striga asiatica TaxID=4170 RepID=A0A5A7Q0G5_STRAF|nr:glycosyltransferase family 61 protein [Striga asiatica]